MADALTENTLQAQFEGVPFPTAEVTVEGGRSFIAHKAYLRPGASVEDTGLDEYTGPLTIPMINTDELVTRYGGPLYPDLRDRLLARFEQTGVGRFVHPLRGPMDAEFVKWTESADPKRRGGVVITAHFVEDSDSSLILLAEDTSIPQDFESVATAQAAAADSYMRAIDPDQSSGWTETSGPVANTLDTLATSKTYGAIDGAVRTSLGIVTANLALSVFGPASAHAAVVTLFTLKSTLYKLRSRALGKLLQSSTIVTPRTMAAWEIAQERYGDASLDQLIMQANSFEDALAIPANSSVIIPPKP